MTWTNRYQHDMTLSIRVWPKNKRTIKASLKQKTWEVMGLMPNADDHLEAWFRYAINDMYAWEMSAEDSYRLASAGASGARFGDMIVRTPGTEENDVKMECWLEVPLTLNPKAWRRKEYGKGDPLMLGTDEQIGDMVKAVWENDITRAKKWDHEYYGFTKAQLEERYADYPRREFTGLYYILNPELVDLNTLAGEVMKGKAILVDKRLKKRIDIDRIDRALDYWTVPGVEPEAPGGEFNPYQLGRSVFWCKDAQIPDWQRGEGVETVKRLRKEEHVEAMRSRVQKHYIEKVTERIAGHYGISRERVASRLIEEGFMDWMVERSEKIWEDPSLARFPGVEAKCQGPIGEAVKILTFCIDAMAIRPPDPLPPLLTPRQQEARLEYQRKKLDAFNKLTTEEQEKALARREHRNRNKPEGIVKRIVGIYALGEGRTADEVHAELVAEGVVDLLVNALKTRRDASKTGKFFDEQSKMYERIGPEAIRLLRQCRTGEAVAAWE